MTILVCHQICFPVSCYHCCCMNPTNHCTSNSIKWHYKVYFWALSYFAYNHIDFHWKCITVSLVKKQTWLHQLLRVKKLKTTTLHPQSMSFTLLRVPDNFIKFTCNWAVMSCFTCFDINGLVQERLTHWSYVFLALTHQYHHYLSYITHHLRSMLLHIAGSYNLRCLIRYFNNKMSVFLTRAHFRHPHTTISLWIHKAFVHQKKNIKCRNGQKLYFETLTMFNKKCKSQWWLILG